MDPVEIGGGLVVWWREMIDMQFLAVSKNVIHVEVNAAFLDYLPSTRSLFNYKLVQQPYNLYQISP